MTIYCDKCHEEAEFPDACTECGRNLCENCYGGPLMRIGTVCDDCASGNYAEPSNPLNTLATQAHKTAVEKGFYDDNRSIAEAIALMHSELSEMLEEVRDHGIIQQIQHNESGKPVGLAIEMADVLIRLFDTAAHLNINLDEAVRVKMRYNAQRPYKHGKRF